MSEGLRLYHNSQATEWRDPGGALPCGAPLRLALDVYGAAGAPLNGVLRLWRDGKGETLIEMQETAGPPGGRRLVAESAAPDEPGLLWYYFWLQGDGGGRFFYGCQADCLGGEGAPWPASDPPSWQITVYRPSPVPAWWKKSVAYQIFVDRFYRGADWDCRDAAALLRPSERRGPRRLLHLDWNDTPFYPRDPEGRITRWPFFGGTLNGVREKLPYLKELGVSVLYLNPVFLGASNHKYDTADYFTIDPGFGGDEAFALLLAAAAAEGISIVLDGVFNHTGRDSLYFDGYGNYGGAGAAAPDSPYHDWFRWQADGGYESWWGVDDLPSVNEMNPDFQDFIWRGRDSVTRHWLRTGVRGFRLDVADELPDDFIKGIRRAIKETNPEGVLIGEVWEDASNKVSYGVRRAYFAGDELDSTMNYPFRELFLGFFLGTVSAESLHRRILSLYENYPRENFYAAMNLLGSHDRERVLTVLSGIDISALAAEEKEFFRLEGERRDLALRRLRALVLVQMTFPGVPCVYYGDEAGMEGLGDPYNRGAFPWGQEEAGLGEFYRRVISWRREYGALTDGDFCPRLWPGGVYGYSRGDREGRIYVAVNPDSQNAKTVDLWESERGGSYPELTGGTREATTALADRDKFAMICTLEPLTTKVYYRPAAGPLPEPVPGRRQAGVLCHVTSLPSPWGVGDLGSGAREFVDFLAASGQTIWQILPVNPPGRGNSPYMPLSAFAGHELLLDLEQLAAQGLLGPDYAEMKKKLCAGVQAERAEFIRAELRKQPFYREAFGRFDQEDAEFRAFCRAEADWLQDYCLFRALQGHLEEADWRLWPTPLREREEEALNSARALLTREVEYYAFLQYEFARQWEALKAYARKRGVTVWGDAPMYMAAESCDVWRRRELFRLEEEGGTPPDDYAAAGQNWEMPVYDWEAAARENYAWWIARLRHSLRRTAKLRLDHFRGFEAYWSRKKGAAQGYWHKGPGRRFFEAVRAELGTAPFFAEDLGFITPEVRVLKELFGLPGVKVLQFSAWEMMGDEMTAADSYNVFYTGTHDNQTLVGWYAAEAAAQPEAPAGGAEAERRFCRRIIARLYAGGARWVILPLQDVLGLDDSHRMNIPGEREGNWGWRVEAEQMTEETAAWLRELAERSDRAPAEDEDGGVTA
ncbi:MAG: 4-alpha-glucanotransferase [Gracilibacteraceae bacterium]|jgi:4-alpha-glucanotransferase|nr:4-alpha-glucanotransferase [Gracilibacteraceae bacterium]